jgi:hypothetical protein
MNVSVVLLRSKGVPLDLGHFQSLKELRPGLVVNGCMAFGTPMPGFGNSTRAKSSRALLLQQPRSAPGMGVLHELYQPQVVAIQAGCIRVRGFEPVASGEATAVVMQEWLISLEVQRT